MSELGLGDGVDLEQDLDDRRLARLHAIGDKRIYQRDAHLYYQGDRADLVFVLASGAVKATCIDANGNETLLKIHGPGSLVGLSALRPNPRRDANGIALEATVTSCFTKNAFFEHMRSDGELSILLVRVLLKRQQELHARVVEFAGQSVEQRLARLLLQRIAELKARSPRDSQQYLAMTHEDLAGLVQSRRQYVTAILRTFVSCGLIENRRRKIRVVDPDGLRRIVTGHSVPQI
ncbi:MAG: Crp/Fnr family transcriptional regulator [Rhodomicrobium sp.]|nr:Crp/Fnr family transcriptional regulator [Rhodomicrobium sp.]